MTITYSVGVRFAGGGIGNTAYHAARGLHRHGLLGQLLCGSYRPTDIPSRLIHAWGWRSRFLRRLDVSVTSRWPAERHNQLYDRWAVRQLGRPRLFHGWNGFCLHSLRRAREAGAVTVVERASSHPAYQNRLLKEEYARRGLSYAYRPAMLQRAIAEIEAADFVLVPSDFVAESCIVEGVDPTRLIQIPFGVDSDRFVPAVDAPPAIPFRVLFVGQIGHRKGVSYLLEAWQQLGWTDAELWLLGRVEPDFKPILARYQTMPGVHLPGHVSDPVRLFQDAHLFVFPTIEEGSALVVYEAMACGLPVITTPNAGALITSGRDGAIVPIRDSHALAEQMAALRDDPARRRHLARTARETISYYTWDRYGDSLAAALQQRLS